MKNQRCKTGSQDQLDQGVPNVEFVTVQITQVNGQLTRDLIVKFQKPHTFFFVAAIPSGYNTLGLYVHFSPLFLTPNPGVNQIQPTGAEQWIPLANSNNSSGRAEGRFIRFTRQVQSFYIDCDHPGNAGAGTLPLTFGGTDDIDTMIAERQ